MRGSLLISFLLCGPGVAACAEAPLAAQGRKLAISAGCGGCHAIPGTGADADVGPPLAGIGRRVYIAGLLPNTPDNMVQWLRNTQTIRPGDAMPNSRLDQAQAEAITAYLETLR